MSTPAITRARDSPSARSAAISPRRWFTDTVSSTPIRRKPKNSVTVARTTEICRKYENSTRLKRSTRSSLVTT